LRIEFAVDSGHRQRLDHSANPPPQHLIHQDSFYATPYSCAKGIDCSRAGMQATPITRQAALNALYRREHDRSRQFVWIALFINMLQIIQRK